MDFDLREDKIPKMVKDRDIHVQALALPLKERAQLAYELLRSLDAEPAEDEGSVPDEGYLDEGCEEAWATEIARRMKEIDNGAVTPESWSVVRERLLSRWRPR